MGLLQLSKHVVQITKLESNCRSGTCLRKPPNKNFLWFNMSQSVICSPVWRFVPRDCSAANGPFRDQLLERDFVTAQRACSRQVTRIPPTLADEAEVASLLQERSSCEIWYPWKRRTFTRTEQPFWRRKSKLSRSFPSSKRTNRTNLMQRLADLLAQRQDRDSLPRPEPEVFCGNPLHYPN